MRQANKRIPESAEKTVRDIRRATRRHHSAEEKIRIVLEGLRGEESIAELCRKEGINQNLYYRWSKEFLEAGKKRLAGDTAREATSDEVKELKAESSAECRSGLGAPSVWRRLPLWQRAHPACWSQRSRSLCVEQNQRRMRANGRTGPPPSGIRSPHCAPQRSRFHRAL